MFKTSFFLLYKFLFFFRFSGTGSLPRGSSISSQYSSIQKGYRSDDDLDNDPPRRQRPQSAKAGGRTPSSVSHKYSKSEEVFEDTQKKQRPQSARPGGRSSSNVTSGLPRRTGSNTNLAFQNSDSTEGRATSADGRQTPTSLPSTPTVRRKLSYQSQSGRRTPQPEESRSRVHQRSATDPEKPVIRSRSVGPSNNRKPLSLAPSNNTFQNNTIKMNQGNKQEVFMISRDDSGKHRVTSQSTISQGQGRPPKCSLPQRPSSAKTRRELSMERSRTLDENELSTSENTKNVVNATNVTADKVLEQVQPRRRRNSSSSFSLNNTFDEYPEAPPVDRKLNAEMEKMFEEYRNWELGLKKRDEEESKKMEKLEKAKLERQGSNSSSSSDTQNKVKLERQVSNSSASNDPQNKVNGTTHVPKIMNPRDRRLNSSDSETSLPGKEVNKNTFMSSENGKCVGMNGQMTGGSTSSLDSRSSGEAEAKSKLNTDSKRIPNMGPSPAVGRKPIIRSLSQSNESMQGAPPSPSHIRKVNMQIDQVLPNTLVTNKLSKRQDSVSEDGKACPVSTNSAEKPESKSRCVESCNASAASNDVKDNSKTDTGSFEVVHYHSPAESSSDETGSRRSSVTESSNKPVSRVRPSSPNPRLVSSIKGVSQTKDKAQRRGSLRTLPKTPDEPAYTGHHKGAPLSSGRTRPITPEPSGRVRPTTPEPSRRFRPTTPDPSRQRPPVTPETTRRRPATANPAGRSRSTAPNPTSNASRPRTPSVGPSQERARNTNPSTSQRPASAKVRSVSSTRQKPGSTTNMMSDTPKPKPLKSHMRSHSTTLLFPDQTDSSKTPEFTVYKDPKKSDEFVQKPTQIYAKFRKDDKDGPRTKIPMPKSDYNRQAMGEGATLRRVDSGVDITSSMSPTDTLRSDSDVMWGVPQEAVGYKAQTIIAYQTFDDDDDTQYF